MSYNITIWYTLELTDFCLPEDVTHNIYRYAHRGDDNYIQIAAGEYAGIIGTVTDGVIKVNTVNLSGSGSGWWMRQFDHIFPKSTGILRAAIIWEDGDYFELFECVNGKISTTRLDMETVVKTYLEAVRGK